MYQKNCSGKEIVQAGQMTPEESMLRTHTKSNAKNNGINRLKNTA